jgi:hypothetical protein
MLRRDALKYAAATGPDRARQRGGIAACPDGRRGVDINNICKPQFGQWA